MARRVSTMRRVGLGLFALALALVPLSLAVVREAKPADLGALLPNAKQTFVDANGLPLAGGSVTFYIPSTTTLKTTWSDPGETVPNTNPVVLDSAGRAVIYGNGDYRQVVKDVFGNTVWDALTQYNVPQGLAVWGGTSFGTANAQAVTASAWTGTNGTVLSWVVNLSNSGATTVTVNGGSSITLVKDAIGGPAALVGNELVAGNVAVATYDGSQLHLSGYPANTGGNLALTGNFSAGGTAAVTGVTTLSGGVNALGALKFTPPLVVPQGRLTLQSGVPVPSTDRSAVTSVYYTPYNGNIVPVYDSTNEVMATFSELTLSIADAAYTGNAVYDVFVFLNSGVTTIATGPAWTTAGNYVRTTVLTTGTGTRATALTRVNGLLVNTGGSMAARNGGSTYTIPTQQGTYVGSLWVDAAGSATTCQATAGQNRTCGLWNMYNRVPLIMTAFDSTVSWNGNNSTNFRAANATAANSITVLNGTADEWLDAVYQDLVQNNTNGVIDKIAVGVASTSTASGTYGYANSSNAATIDPVTVQGHAAVAPFIGTQVVIALESANNAGTQFNGTQAFMELRATTRY